LDQWVAEWFVGLAFEPMKVYFTVVLMMLLSSFGLPIPEEITLLSAGLIAYMGSHPHLYPPPYEGAVGVNTTVLAVVCFLAVFLSDVLVFSLGKYFGLRLRRSRRFGRFVKPTSFEKVERWVSRYGVWMAGGFRFTPGVRFPGHMVCGMFGIPLWKFVLVDGMAALVSVPTQIILIAKYGEVILEKMREFKILFLWGAFFLVLFYGIKRLYRVIQSRQNASSGQSE
jgi:membrane protein DedA with SNARE-associated domain